MGGHGRLDESGASRPTISRASARSVDPGNLGSMGSGPVRTCVGCRQRDSQQVMVRFVLSRDDVDGTVGVVADFRRVRPGRGAWLHDNARCAELAVKRKAFSRALRVTADLMDGLTNAVGSMSHATDTLGPMPRVSTTSRQGSGSDADGHPMSTQR